MNVFSLLSLVTIQSILLASGQVLLKLGLANMEQFGWNTRFWYSVFVNWQFAVSGICFGSGSLLWMYILKKYPLSVAYPMISLSYVFGMVASIIIFHEVVELRKWLGVVLIVIGCCLIAK